MEQSSKNENNINETCDIVRIRVVMEKNNVEEGSAINLSLQSKIEKKLEIKNEELMKQNLKKISQWKKIVEIRRKKCIVLVICFCINDSQRMNLDHPQLMRCF